jgi:organic hydroperoxide reductase OsmC/OhrA
MDKIDKVLYTAKAHTTGGRDGASRSSDGNLDAMKLLPGKATLTAKQSRGKLSSRRLFR